MEQPVSYTPRPSVIISPKGKPEFTSLNHKFEVSDSSTRPTQEFSLTLGGESSALESVAIKQNGCGGKVKKKPNVITKLDGNGTKRKKCLKISKICKVCGAHSKSMHFGAMSCDSCKSFFRRSIQNETYGSFVCQFNNNCIIKKIGRDKCKYCRFQKCLNVGMKISLVMSEKERINLWKSKLEKCKSDSTTKASVPENAPVNGLKKRKDEFRSSIFDSNPTPQKLHFNSISTPLPLAPSHPKVSYPTTALRSPSYDLELPSTSLVNLGASTSTNVPSRNHLLSQKDQELIKHLKKLQEITFQLIPYSNDCSGDSEAALASVFFATSKRLNSFLRRLQDIYELREEDREVVLKNGISMALYLYGAYMYDTELKQFPDPACKSYLKIPNVITLPTLKSFAVYPDTYNLIMIFYNTYSQLLKDEVILILLTIIALFSKNNKVIDLEKCAELWNKYVLLLKNYLTCKRGEIECNNLLPKFLDCFYILKSIIVNHDRLNIQMLPMNSNPMVCQPFIQAKMVALTALLERALVTDLSKYSSVIKPSHSIESILLSSKAVVRKKDSSNNEKYSPLTISIFGRENKTDELAAMLWQELLTGQRSIK